jgi:hypothetical protein
MKRVGHVVESLPVGREHDGIHCMMTVMKSLLFKIHFNFFSKLWNR